MAFQSGSQQTSDISRGEKYVSLVRSALLNATRLPGRLTTMETALLLGVQEHDIRVLVASKLLKPLGQPTQSAPKWFFTAEILDHCLDPKFMDRVTRAITQQWRKRNTRLIKQQSMPQAA